MGIIGVLGVLFPTFPMAWLMKNNFETGPGLHQLMMRTMVTTSHRPLYFDQKDVTLVTMGKAIGKP